MKSNRILVLFLSFFVILSIFLTYYLLYDLTSLKSLIWGKDLTDTEEQVILHGDRKLPNFFQPNKLEFKDIVKPFKYIYRNDQSTEWIVDHKGMDAIQDLIYQHPIKMNRDIPVEDPKFIEDLYVTNHLQIQFADNLTISLLDHFVEDISRNHKQWLVDAIFYPLDGEKTVYLVNTQSNEYMVGQLDQALANKDLQTILKESALPSITVQGYIGNYGMIYLPDESVTLKDQIFTLEKIPEHLFLTAFSENAVLKKTEKASDTLTYFNYQFTLDFTENKQMLNIRVNRTEDSLNRNQTDKILNSFKYISNYDYWQGPIRLMGAKNSLAQYRRFYAGLPIFTNSKIADYGASRIHLRNNDSGDVYRYQIPLLVFHAHIPDQSKDVVIESADEIFNIVEDNGYVLSQFDDMFFAFEWQADMEGDKKAHLIPKWYIKVGDNFYSLDQISSPAFRAEFSSQNDVPGGE